MLRLIARWRIIFKLNVVSIFDKSMERGCVTDYSSENSQTSRPLSLGIKDSRGNNRKTNGWMTDRSVEDSLSLCFLSLAAPKRSLKSFVHLEL